MELRIKDFANDTLVLSDLINEGMFIDAESDYQQEIVTVRIDKDEAQAIIKHLQEQFNL